MKGRLYRYILVLLIIVLVCIVKSPTLPVFVGIISGFMLGAFFIMFGLEDEVLDKRMNKGETK